MDILWISDSPDTPSGFGNVTRFVCEGLARRGHNVNILGWQTVEAHDWNGCKVFPNGRLPLGSDALYGLLVRLRPEVVIALGDVWWLPYFSQPHIRRQMELIDAPWALYFPIDGDMEGERLPASWVELLRHVDVPIAMSQYGQRIVSQLGISSHYIPHGVELDIFHPPADREWAKEQVGAKGKFLILSDSRNQPRKLLPRLLDIFAKFACGRPDVLLHLHTDPDDEFARSFTYSYDVRADIAYLGIESQVRFSPGMAMKRGGGLSLRALAAYYQAADIHLLVSSGEGFGLPTLQAAAAGSVPFAGRYSASPELVEGHGETLDIASWSENEFGIRRGHVDVDDAVQKLALYYDNRELLRRKSAESREFALTYGWDKVVDEWDKLLRSIGRRGRRILRPPAATPPSKVKELVPGLRSLPQGVSVNVKMVEHEFGRLEASIVADARGQTSDVIIPTRPRPAVIGGLKILRNVAYVGFTPASECVFKRLRTIFPLLWGWMSVDGLQAPQINDDPAITPVFQGVRGEDARLEVARSILLLDLDGFLPEELLWDAALFGVPCIGPSDLHKVLWPELASGNAREAAVLGRSLLTDAAMAAQVIAEARHVYRSTRITDELEIAACLRRLAAAGAPAPVLAQG